MSEPQQISPRSPAAPHLRYLQPPPLFEGKYLVGRGRADAVAARARGSVPSGRAPGCGVRAQDGAARPPGGVDGSRARLLAPGSGRARARDLSLDPAGAGESFAPCKKGRRTDCSSVGARGGAGGGPVRGSLRLAPRPSPPLPEFPFGSFILLTFSRAQTERSEVGRTGSAAPRPSRCLQASEGGRTGPLLSLVWKWGGTLRPWPACTVAPAPLVGAGRGSESLGNLLDPTPVAP